MLGLKMLNMSAKTVRCKDRMDAENMKSKQVSISNHGRGDAAAAQVRDTRQKQNNSTSHSQHKCHDFGRGCSSIQGSIDLV